MSEPTSRATADRGPTLIAAAILGAALIVSWGLSGDDTRYAIAAAGDTVVRLDTDSGEMLACNQQRCVRVEAPDRERQFGPLKVVVDATKKENALPAPTANQTP